MNRRILFSVLLAAVSVNITYAKFNRQRETNLKYCPATLPLTKPVEDFPSEDKMLWQDINLDEGELLEIPPDTVINTNTIWDSDVHLQGTVYVENAMLVLKPGISVYNAPEFGKIVVRNNGVIKAKGTPNDRIYFYSDNGYWWYGYNYAIKIEATASTLSEIQYCRIAEAKYGIWIQDKRLESPIRDNEICYCEEGILQEGPMLTDVINNHIYQTYHVGIYVYLTDVNGIASRDAEILIENNLVNGNFDEYGYGQQIGIGVVGAYEEENAGLVMIVNNHIDSSYTYAIYQDGWQEAYRVCNGYSGNDQILNPGNPFEDIGGVFMDFYYDPFYYNFYTTPFYLKQDCPLINAGLEYVEETTLIGKTNDINGVPDCNKVDIGYHFPNWNYSNAGMTSLQADFDNNYKVDYNDLAYFTDYWLFDYNEPYQVWLWDYDDSGKVDYGDLKMISEYWLEPFDFIDFADFANQWQKEIDERLYDGRPDLYNDGIVNFRDFAILAGEWGITAEGNPAISLSVTGDVNNLKGEVGVSVGGCSYSTSTAFIFMDGQLMGETDYNVDEGEPGITINTPSYINGGHLLKAVIIDQNGLITLSENLAVDFNNPVHCLSLGDTYEPNKPLRLLGFSATGDNLRVKLAKWNGDMVWSQETCGDLDVNIPGDVLAGQIYDVSIEQEISGLKLLDLRLSDLNSLDFGLLNSDSSWEPVWNRAIAAVYDPNKQYRFAIFIPSAWGMSPPPIEWYPHNSIDSRKKAVAAMVNYCEQENTKMPYIILYGDNCTWDNFVKVLANPTVCYTYVVSRGASSIYNTKIQQSVQRTWFKLSNGKVLSHINSGEEWDSKIHSMASLGYGDINKFKMVWIDICLNGLFDDMANAWVKIDSSTFGPLFISWNALIEYDNDSDFCSWTKFFWDDPDGWGVGGRNSYFQAFTRAQIEVHSGAWISGKVTSLGNIYNFHFVSVK